MTGAGLPIGEDDLQAAIDGRLSGARQARIDAYLAEHPDVRERIDRDRRLRDDLRAQLASKVHEPIPDRLRVSAIRARRRGRLMRQLVPVAAAVLLFALGAASGWYAAILQPQSGKSATPVTVAIARDAAQAYRTYVVEVVHPVEVPASNETHLLQWLSKRLGRPLAAPDLARFGYRLIGGRLLPGNTAAAQLMYEDGAGRRLTLYVQAAQGDETAFRFREENGAATFAWIDQGFGFAVTAAGGRDELLPIAEAVYKTFDQTRIRRG